VATYVLFEVRQGDKVELIQRRVCW